MVVARCRVLVIDILVAALRLVLILVLVVKLIIGFVTNATDWAAPAASH
jgi:hypothetical protein